MNEDLNKLIKVYENIIDNKDKVIESKNLEIRRLEHKLKIAREALKKIDRAHEEYKLRIDNI